MSNDDKAATATNTITATHTRRRVNFMMTLYGRAPVLRYDGLRDATSAGACGGVFDATILNTITIIQANGVEETSTVTIQLSATTHGGKRCDCPANQ